MMMELYRQIKELMGNRNYQLNVITAKDIPVDPMPFCFQVNDQIKNKGPLTMTTPKSRDPAQNQFTQIPLGFKLTDLYGAGVVCDIATDEDMMAEDDTKGVDLEAFAKSFQDVQDE